MVKGLKVRGPQVFQGFWVQTFQGLGFRVFRVECSGSGGEGLKVQGSGFMAVQGLRVFGFGGDKFQDFKV